MKNAFSSTSCRQTISALYPSTSCAIRDRLYDASMNLHSKQSFASMLVGKGCCEGAVRVLFDTQHAALGQHVQAVSTACKCGSDSGCLLCLYGIFQGRGSCGTRWQAMGVGAHWLGQ